MAAYVYFIEAENKAVKIGYTENNLKKRLIDLQSSNCDKLKILGYIKCKDAIGAKIIEREIHERFRTDNIQGEWFEKNDHILSYVSEFCENNLQEFDEPPFVEINIWRIWNHWEGPRPAELNNPTYVLEYVKCGKEGCRCQKGKPHGPYWYLYVKDRGKTKSKYIGKRLKGGPAVTEEKT